MAKSYSRTPKILMPSYSSHLYPRQSRLHSGGVYVVGYKKRGQMHAYDVGSGNMQTA